MIPLGVRHPAENRRESFFRMLTRKAPALDRRSYESNDACTLKRICERTRAGVETVFEEGDAVSCELDIVEIGWRQTGVQEPPLFIVGHGCRACDMAFYQIKAIGALRRKIGSAALQSVLFEPVLNGQLVSETPYADIFPDNIRRLVDPGITPADQRCARMPEELCNILDLGARLPGRNGIRHPGDRQVRMPGVQHLQRVNHPSIGSRGTAFEEFDLQSFLLVHAQYVRNIKSCELSLMGPQKLNAQGLGVERLDGQQDASAEHAAYLYASYEVSFSAVHGPPFAVGESPLSRGKTILRSECQQGLVAFRRSRCCRFPAGLVEIGVRPWFASQGKSVLPVSNSKLRLSTSARVSSPAAAQRSGA